MTQTSQSDSLNEDNLLRYYLVGQVLKELGLVTVDLTVVKADKQECYRYDYDYSRPTAYPGYAQEPYEIVRKPNGTHEKCNDVWDYIASINFVDPTIADKASVDLKARSLSDVIDDRPSTMRAVIVPAGSAGATTVSLGSVEIVEVSDVVPGERPGTATLGFKYRVNTSPLGAIFDIAGSTHKALPAGVRKLLEDRQLDERLTNPAQGMDSDGLRVGHADLVLEGSVIRQWRIAQVHFDGTDNTNYTFHHVD